MSVYVDQAVPVKLAYPSAKWPFKYACHMWADTLDELHAMADRLGLLRRWFQDKPRWPHYDLTQSKRRLALRYGAVEKSLLKHIREQRKADNDSTGGPMKENT